MQIMPYPIQVLNSKFEHYMRMNIIDISFQCTSILGFAIEQGTVYASSAYVSIYQITLPLVLLCSAFKIIELNHVLKMFKDYQHDYRHSERQLIEETLYKKVFCVYKVCFEEKIGCVIISSTNQRRREQRFSWSLARHPSILNIRFAS